MRTDRRTWRSQQSLLAILQMRLKSHAFPFNDININFSDLPSSRPKSLPKSAFQLSPSKTNLLPILSPFHFQILYHLAILPLAEGQAGKEISRPEIS
jgi:hypothetical protein